MKYVRYNAIGNGCMLSIDSIHWADKGYFPTSFKFKQSLISPENPTRATCFAFTPGK